MLQFYMYETQKAFSPLQHILTYNKSGLQGVLNTKTVGNHCSRALHTATVCSNLVKNYHKRVAPISDKNGNFTVLGRAFVFDQILLFNHDLQQKIIKNPTARYLTVEAGRQQFRRQSGSFYNWRVNGSNPSSCMCTLPLSLGKTLHPTCPVFAYTE